MADREMGNYSFCCRLCLSEKQDSLKSVFDDASRGDMLVEKISTVVGVTVSYLKRFLQLVLGIHNVGKC